jgi:signal transduction histidine kinase
MNAMQAMEGEGGLLKMSVASDNQWIVISFVDDGPGIPEEDLQRVLLPYVTMRPGGTGLGLAIARRVAERHGGRLELDSELGVGTEVRFLLPTEDGGTT